MGCFCSLGESVYTGRKDTGLQRFGRALAVPEDAEKPKRLAPGVKAEQSSSVLNAARILPELFFARQLVCSNTKAILCLFINPPSN